MTAAAVFAVAGGSAALAGWATNTPRLTDWRNDAISMFPNAALCAIASGLALSVPRSDGRWLLLGRGLASFVAAIGALTLLEHITGVSFGIDTLLFDRAWGQGAAAAPMRIGPPASTSFMLLGTAVLLLDRGRRARGASVILSLVVAGLAILPLTGLLYGAQQMYSLPRLTGISFPTSSIIFALALAAVASVPEHEPMRSILDPGAAGMLARRAIPLAILVPITLGWMSIAIQDHDVVDVAFGTALARVLEVALFTALLWSAVSLVRAHETAFRRTEIELRRKAGQLTTVLDTAALGLSRVAPDGTILWANDAELRILGHPAEAYVGRNVAELCVDGEPMTELLARLRRGEDVVDQQIRMRASDGSIRWILIDATVVREEGRYAHAQWFTRDVTERRRAEELRALLSAIVADSDDAIVSKTLDGIITSWNAGAERMFGWTAAEMIGKSIEQIIPLDRRDEEREILRRLRAGERIDHFETVRRGKERGTFVVSLTISPVKDASGAIIGASKIARDVTERRRLEAERDESTRRKDEFLAILAHELRNPLAPVRSAVHYLKLAGWSHAELRRPLEMIERQVAQMSRLIDDLLDVSRISRGVLEIRRAPVAIADVVAAAVEASHDELRAQGHHLQTKLPGSPLMVLADRERLAQVLGNLLGNAAKYTPSGGHIVLTVGVADDVLLVSVADDGIGIPDAKLGEIFELFSRIDTSLERQGGLGVGLTLVRQLVELHGGTIEARSNGLGQGSEFVVKLPIVMSDRATVDAADEASPPCVPRRILVADDNRDAAESLRLVLEMGGHEVQTAFDGEAAVHHAEAFAPDVALIDIGMPRANGYEVARRIREHTWGKSMYLVALTGWGQEDDKRRAREAGFDAHLVKPVPPEMLDRLLATSIDPSAVRSAS